MIHRETENITEEKPKILDIPQNQGREGDLSSHVRTGPPNRSTEKNSQTVYQNSSSHVWLARLG